VARRRSRDDTRAARSAGIAAASPDATADADTLAGSLLDWYDRHRRTLPWRAAPGATADPYHVWLSEIMLQQTTVATVGPYFKDFLDRFSTVHDLAAADLDSVLHAWQGLGYYARARNMHKCARVVSERHGGRFPDSQEALSELPGIGRYTAAAVAAIAFDRPATVMDGNVERVIARLRAVTEPLPDAKERLREAAAAITPQQRPGDYAQAIMDLGATVCTPRRPRCILCPWQAACTARKLGIEESLPAKKPKPEKPTRRGVAFWLVRGDGAVLLRRRPEKGLLGGMMEVPSTDWSEAALDVEAARKHAPVGGIKWRPVSGVVRHTFTHFHLELTLLAGLAPKFAPVPGGVWCLPDRFGEHALPTVMKKVVSHALKKA